MMTYSEMKNSVLKSMNKWDYDVMCFIHTFLVGLDIIDDDVLETSKAPSKFGKHFEQEVQNECED